MPELADKLRRLNAAARALATATDPDTLIEQILDSVQEIFRRETAAVLLRESEGNALQIAAARGYDAQQTASYRADLGAGVAGKVAASGAARLVADVTAEPDYYPVQKGRLRVQKAHGTWTLKPVGSDKTHITFTMHLEPGGGIPQWMINARIVVSPFEALTNLRATVGK